MAAGVAEKKNFDEMCSNFEQMELDVRFYAVEFIFLSVWIVDNMFYVCLFLQGVATGEVFSQLMAIYLLQNDM